MANGLLLRAASPCLRPAAAATADSDRGHGVVTVSCCPTPACLPHFSRLFLFLFICGLFFFLGCRRSVIRGRAALLSGWQDLADFQHDTVYEVGVGVEHDPFMELKARFMDFKQRNYVSWWLLVLTPGSALVGFWGFSRGKHLQFVMWQIWYHHTRSFIKNWVSIGKSARLSTKAAAGNLSFEKQCTHCEKESINSSLLNLLTYPWIEKRVNEGTLNLHGGYYNFVDCTFEKWTLVYRQGLEGGSKYAIKNRSTWS
ncbi:hypothetical protein HU200_001105 [Digitaria exilis]|uniref:Carbonic anhydrase n=1 Tax=Digitaria exilis TaxID=1010633 RepID=A0A835FYD1_9POAL|nr:hypothetical protein HU200_001105 [Digitaria exilis]